VTNARTGITEFVSIVLGRWIPVCRDTGYGTVLLFALYIQHLKVKKMAESASTSTTEYKADIIAKHLKAKCGALGVGRSSRPLMVSMQGPQGAGK
jgi:hypothetical protein